MLRNYKNFSYIILVSLCFAPGAREVFLSAREDFPSALEILSAVFPISYTWNAYNPTPLFDDKVYATDCKQVFSLIGHLGDGEKIYSLRNIIFCVGIQGEANLKMPTRELLYICIYFAFSKSPPGSVFLSLSQSLNDYIYNAYNEIYRKKKYNKEYMKHTKYIEKHYKNLTKDNYVTIAEIFEKLISNTNQLDNEYSSFESIITFELRKMCDSGGCFTCNSGDCFKYLQFIKRWLQISPLGLALELILKKREDEEQLKFFTDEQLKFFTKEGKAKVREIAQKIHDLEDPKIIEDIKRKIQDEERRLKKAIDDVEG